MEQILIDLKKSLQEITGDRLIKMVLYGSRARGDFNELESLKKLAKNLLGLTATQITVALGEGSLVEVEKVPINPLF